MAFGFIKKVFSFGQKPEEKAPPQVETAAPAAEILPPLREPAPVVADALVAELAPERGTLPTTPPEEPRPADPAPTPEPEPVPAPEPAPVEPPKPVPAPQPDVPQPEVPTPPAPPAPNEVPAPPPAEMPQPAPAQPIAPPAEIPAAPVELPPAAPVELPTTPMEIPVGTPDRGDGGRGFVAPSAVGIGAEILPPLHHAGAMGAGAVATDALRADTAAEPNPVVLAPAVPSPSAGKVTVSKAVERRVEAEASPMAATPAGRASWLQRLREGLSRSSRELSTSISGIFTKRKLDEASLQDLEDVLIRADLGMETAIRVTDALSAGRYGRDVSDGDVRAIMAAEVEKVLTPVALPLELDLSHKPHVVLVVGVNGTGKTTTIGKLAAKLTAGGLKVTLAAGDTFRAAAIEQLKIWGERTGSTVVSSKLGADAAGLAFDAFEKAKAAGSDVLIIDTAGRLQNKAELMAELEKIVRVLGKLDPEAPHTVLQTVDATTGQNALSQVEIFRNIAGVNGLVMTKLDGTARGGILVAIAAKHKLPVYFIGVGEQIDDLEPFSAGDFAKAIAGIA